MKIITTRDNKSVSVLIKPGRWLTSYLLFFYCTGCYNNTEYKTYIPTIEDSLKTQTIITHAQVRIAAISKEILPGDVITRTGSDFTSECLRQINLRDKTWSHCGIASIENDSVFVYHALGGEFNPDETIKRDYIQVFADPINNRGMGIYRQQMSKNQTQQLLNIVKNLCSLGVKFDMDFDLQTDQRMYCAEFVYKAFLWSSKGKMHFSTSKLNNKIFIGVDDIILYSGCKKIEKIFYKTDAF